MDDRFSLKQNNLNHNQNLINEINNLSGMINKLSCKYLVQEDIPKIDDQQRNHNKFE